LTPVQGQGLSRRAPAAKYAPEWLTVQPLVSVSFQPAHFSGVNCQFRVRYVQTDLGLIKQTWCCLINTIIVLKKFTPQNTMQMQRLQHLKNR